MKKYTAYIMVFAIVLFGFAKTGLVLADTGSNSDDSPTTVPVSVGSDSDVSTPVTSGSDSDNASTTPSNSGSDDGDTTGITASSTNSNDGDTIGIVASSTGSNDGSATGFIPTSSGSNGDESVSTTTSTTTTTASTTPTTPTPSTSGVSFSGGGGGGAAYVPFEATTSTSTVSASTTNPIVTSSCPFLSGYVIPGQANDPANIAKLQIFLSTYENDSSITVNGVLDQATINGIIAFQQKYVTQIMGPWGVVTPSGEVYITTLNEINNITCAEPIVLTPADLAIINAYKASLAASSTSNITGTSATEGSSTAGNNLGGASTTPNNSALTGNVVSSGAANFFNSFFSKIFSFFGVK